MTSAHIATLHFDGKSEGAKKRLQKLKAAGLIAERRRQVNEPAVLFLTRQALKLLDEHGILAEYPRNSIPSLEKRAQVSALTIAHELEVMDVKAAVFSAVGKSEGLSLETFSTWPALHAFTSRRPGTSAPVIVRPDGFIKIQETGADGSFSYSFFLEVDRSSETLDTLSSRCAAYTDYYRTGGFAVRNGATHTEYEAYPFRVLVVCKSAERRNNSYVKDVLREKIERQGQGRITLVNFTKLDGLKEEMMGVKLYTMKFEAEIKFNEDCMWGPFNIDGSWSGQFQTITGTPTALRSFSPEYLGKRAVKQGQKTKVTTEFHFEKTEKGWQCMEMSGLPAATAKVEKSDKTASADKCREHLKQIALACRIWSGDNHEVFPKDLISISNQLSIPWLLVCPADVAKGKPQHWDYANVSYSLLLPGIEETDANDNRALVKCPIHGLTVTAKGDIKAE